MTTGGWGIVAVPAVVAGAAALGLPAGWAELAYAVAAVALTARLAVVLVRGRARIDLAWWLLAGGVLAFGAAGVAGYLPGTPAVASMRFAMIGAGCVSSLAASARFIAIRTNLRDLDGIVDGLIVWLSITVVLWELVVGPRLTAGGTVGSHAAVIAFLLAQALVISLAVRFLFWGAWRVVSAWLVFGATLAGCAANIGYVSALPTGGAVAPPWVAALWLASLLLVALAASHGSRSTLTVVALPGLSVVPFARLVISAGALAAACVIVFDHARVNAGGLVPAVGSLVLTAMVVARLFRLVIAREEARAELALRSEQQRAVVRLGQRALAGNELARLFAEAAVAVAETLHVDHCGVFEPTGQETLALRAGVGWECSAAHRPIVSTAEPFFGVPLAAGAPGHLENDRGGGDRPAELLRTSQVVSGVSVPIGTPSVRYGVLAAASTRARRFTADDVTFLRAVGNVLTGAIERNRIDDDIRHAALHDTLTGLPNRVLLLDRMESALARAFRMHTKVAVMVVDLDDFSAVNDMFGRRAGDQLLAAVARRLQKALRSEDTLARLAGDEFVVVCERIEDLATISVIAQRIVDTLAQPFVLDDGTAQVSASVGIAVGSDLGDDVDQLLRQADAAMYLAKQDGSRYELTADDWTVAQQSA